MVECLSVLDDGALFSHLRLRDVNRGEHSHHRHASELECVVAIGLSLGVLPRPGFVIGATNDRFEFHLVTQIADPPRRSTRFHDNQIDFFRGKELLQVVTLRTDGFKVVLSRACVVETADGVEFAKIE